jgi:hypothetical protein
MASRNSRSIFHTDSIVRLREPAPHTGCPRGDPATRTNGGGRGAGVEGSGVRYDWKGHTRKSTEPAFRLVADLDAHPYTAARLVIGSPQLNVR